MDDLVDRQAIHAEMERARLRFHELVSAASREDLRRATRGTRWTNAQLLFHMLFGYIIVRRLLPLVRLFGRLPEEVGRTFSELLSSSTRPFHFVNYLGSCAGALVFNDGRLAAMFDRTVASLHRRLDLETDRTLARSMHFPTGWDPYFADRMSLLEVYHYATLHFDHHCRQLTLEPPA